MVQQGGEPRTPDPGVPPLAHAPGRSNASSRLCVRDAASGSVFPSVGRLPSTASADGSVPVVVRRLLGTTRPSDFPRACMSGVRSCDLPRPTRRTIAAGARGISRFPCEEFPRMLRVSDCAGSEGGSPMTPPSVLPSASLNGVGTPEDLISQLDGWPACAPVNASPAALRPPTHDSGSG